ncbi:hypothetical protein QBC35DRAFT_516386 [Podospora australis]|uniref:Uncharacterized protein n=1 Tax=Podospora australis TaxID=1536484 RepID=A0AAN7AHS4_9PEZI|nr:hypothetical protein QBC35DRAFT_516386 [Podospora australis]
MPTLRHLPLDSSVGPDPPVLSRHQRFKTFGTHLYLALAALAVLIVIRLIKSRLSKSQSSSPSATTNNIKENKSNYSTSPTSSSSLCHRKHNPPVLSRWPWPRSGQGAGPEVQDGSYPQHAGRAATAPLSFSTLTGPSNPFGQSPAMGGSDGDPSKDRLGSASRGVSTKGHGRAGSRRQRQHNPSQAGRNAADQNVWRPEDSHSSHFSSWDTFEGHDNTGFDGWEHDPMASQSSYIDDSAWGMDDQAGPSSVAYDYEAYEDEPLGSVAGQGATFTDVDYTTPRHFSRPPQPPPLTQHTFGDSMYPFEDRRPSYAVSIPPELDANFIHQPNPEYAGASTSSDVLSSSPRGASPVPRRRSYNRSIPVGIPIPTATSASFADSLASTNTFSPSSYPPTSPLLPPPPPGHDAPPEYVYVGGPGGPGVFLEDREIDLHGEIVSVMDHSGHGWKRHTRVYGGGVCLACMAAEDQGGFYGDKVPLSDRR